MNRWEIGVDLGCLTLGVFVGAFARLFVRVFVVLLGRLVVLLRRFVVFT